jgi:hypothetical protein
MKKKPLVDARWVVGAFLAGMLMTAPFAGGAAHASALGRFFNSLFGLQAPVEPVVDPLGTRPTSVISPMPTTPSPIPNPGTIPPALCACPCSNNAAGTATTPTPAPIGTPNTAPSLIPSEPAAVPIAAPLTYPGPGIPVQPGTGLTSSSSKSACRNLSGTYDGEVIVSGKGATEDAARAAAEQSFKSVGSQHAQNACSVIAGAKTGVEAGFLEQLRCPATCSQGALNVSAGAPTIVGSEPPYCYRVSDGYICELRARVACQFTRVCNSY